MVDILSFTPHFIKYTCTRLDNCSKTDHDKLQYKLVGQEFKAI